MQRRLRVWRLLPPRKCFGAHSTSCTLAPARRALIAAHSAALPPPSTRTSQLREASIVLHDKWPHTPRAYGTSGRDGSIGHAKLRRRRHGPRSKRIAFGCPSARSRESDPRAALVQGLEEIPDGINVVVISRADPSPEFARLVASRRIARIDAAALSCTADEAQAMLGTDRLDPKSLQRIHRQSEGWVAALVLLREHLSRPGAELEESLGEGKDAIFQYFAGEIFNRAKPENQRVLMLTALPRSITPSEAVELTGTDDAPRLLDYLYRRHLFVDRRCGEQTTYHYHALFREFLHDEIGRRMPRDERRQAQSREIGR